MTAAVSLESGEAPGDPTPPSRSTLVAQEIGHPQLDRPPDLGGGEDSPGRRVDRRADATVRADERCKACVQRFRDAARRGFCHHGKLDVRRGLQVPLVRDEIVGGRSARPPCRAETEHRPCGEPRRRARTRLREAAVGLLTRAHIRCGRHREERGTQESCYAHTTSVCSRFP